MQILIQFRTSMEMMGFTLAFIDIDLDKELQDCLVDKFLIELPTKTPTFPTTTKPGSPLPTENPDTDSSEQEEDHIFS